MTKVSEFLPLELPRTDFELPKEYHGIDVVNMSEQALERISDETVRTPLIASEVLGSKDATVFVKDETQQIGRCFKFRGALNSLLAHADSGMQRYGTASAGSFAIGLAQAVQRHGGELEVVVPAGTNARKLSIIKASLYGRVTVTEYGRNFSEALANGLEHFEEQGMPFLHPFGPDSIAGAASIGHELADEMPDMTHLVLPVGGGSLLPGAASVVKERLPGVQVVAVQVERCTAYIDSLIAGSPRMADNVDTRFSGIAVGQTQPLNLALGSPLIDQAVVLDPRYAYETVHLYKGETGTLLEDSAAVSLGAVRYLASLPAYQGAKFVTVASGGNPDDLIERYAAAVARRAQENRQFSNRRPEKPPATLVYFTPK